MKKILFIIGFALLLSATASATQATLLSVHGFVKDSSGNALPAGSITIDVCTDSGGTNCLLTGGETFNNAVNQGAFDVLVGSTKTLSLNFNQDYYMKVTVNATQMGLFKFRGGQGQIGPDDIDTTATYTVGGLNVGSIGTQFTGILNGAISGIRGITAVYRIDNDGNIWARSSVTSPELISTAGITLGGTRRTTWPGPGGNIIDTLSDTLTAGSNASAFNGTTTIGGPFISNTSVSSPELISTAGITLGGVRRTTWPSGGGTQDCIILPNNVSSPDSSYQVSKRRISGKNRNFEDTCNKTACVPATDCELNGTWTIRTTCIQCQLAVCEVDPLCIGLTAPCYVKFGNNYVFDYSWQCR